MNAGWITTVKSFLSYLKQFSKYFTAEKISLQKMDKRWPSSVHQVVQLPDISHLQPSHPLPGFWWIRCLQHCFLTFQEVYPHPRWPCLPHTGRGRRMGGWCNRTGACPSCPRTPSRRSRGPCSQKFCKSHFVSNLFEYVSQVVWADCPATWIYNQNGFNKRWYIEELDQASIRLNLGRLSRSMSRAEATLSLEHDQIQTLCVHWNIKPLP